MKKSYARRRLTDEIIAANPYDGKQLKLRDGQGLFLQVSSLSKRWRYDFRYNGQRKHLALGVYPSVSIEGARSATERVRKALQEGLDLRTIRRISGAIGTTKRPKGSPLTHDDIVSLSIEKPMDQGGVYFLIKDKQIVYVGMTASFISRIADHISEGVKDFDSYYLHPTDDSVAPAIESYYITLLQPRFNATNGMSFTKLFGDSFA